MTTTNDPFEAADNPQIKPAEYFGKLEVDAWFCALVKGQGKVPFDTALSISSAWRLGALGRQPPSRSR